MLNEDYGNCKRARIYDSEAEQMLTNFLDKQKVLSSRIVKQNPWLAEFVEKQVILSRAEIIKAITRS